MDSDFWVNSVGAPGDDYYRAYGSTGANSSPNTKIRDSEEIDIQLHDFKVGMRPLSSGAHLKEPLIAEHMSPTVVSVDKKTATRPTSLHSLLSAHSSEHQSGYSDTSFNQHESWIKHPKVRENWKTVGASAFLTLLGLVLILTGIGLALTPAIGYHCLIFGVIGLLCVIPGGYHFVYIYCAALGRPGYEFENLPVLR